tara:strand:+ start:1475 stop:2347 length:873 start_codon:yes stop_codon:yes gene_type:complete
MEDILIKEPGNLVSRLNFRESLEFSSKENRKLDRVIGAYRFPKDSYIRCGISNCRTLHGSGFLVTTSDGLETCVGNICGAKHLGVEFKIERNKFKRIERRNRNINTIKKYQSSSAELLSRINQEVARAEDFLRLRNNLDTSKLRLLYNMIREGTEIIQSDVHLNRDDARALHQALEVNIRFNDWYKNTRPTVSDLKIRLAGLSSFSFPYKETLINNTKTPAELISKLSDDEINCLPDKSLDNYRKSIQDMEKNISIAKESLDSAIPLIMSIIENDTLRFLPGLYRSDEIY